jgi:hypothetical protein
MREEQNATTFLAGLLRQLVKKEHTQSQRVQALVEQCSKAGRRPSLDELAGLLEFVAETFTTVFLVIDALDECQSAEWPQLISQLRNLQARVPVIRLMVTTRPQLAFGAEFEDAAKVEICAHDADLGHYINSQMPRLSKHVLQTPGLQDKVVSGIIHAANGM